MVEEAPNRSFARRESAPFSYYQQPSPIEQWPWEWTATQKIWNAATRDIGSAVSQAGDWFNNTFGSPGDYLGPGEGFELGQPGDYLGPGRGMGTTSPRAPSEPVPYDENYWSQYAEGQKSRWLDENPNDYSNLIGDELAGTLAGLTDARRREEEKYALRLSEIDLAQQQALETFGFRSDVLDAEARRLAEQYNLTMDRFALEEQALDRALGEGQANLALTEANASALDAEYETALRNIGELVVNGEIDVEALREIAEQGQANLAQVFDEATVEAQETRATDLADPALEAVADIVGYMEEPMAGELAAQANVREDTTVAMAESIARQFDADRELTEFDLMGRQTISDAQFTKRIEAQEKSLEDLKMRRQAFELDKQGAELNYNQSREKIAEDRTKAQLDRKHALEDFAMDREGVGLMFRQTLEQLGGVEIDGTSIQGSVNAIIEANGGDRTTAAGQFAAGVADKVLLEAWGDMEPTDLNAWRSFMSDLIADGVSSGRELRAQKALFDAGELDEESYLIDPSTGEFVLTDEEILVLGNGLDAYDQGWQAFYDYSQPVLGEYGKEAPDNYANREKPEYLARAEFAGQVARQIQGLFDVEKIGGVGYYREPDAHEDAAGRSPNSDHLSAGAIDVYASPEEMARIEEWANQQPFVSFVSYSGDEHHEGHHVHISFMLGYGS